MTTNVLINTLPPPAQIAMHSNFTEISLIPTVASTAGDTGNWNVERPDYTQLKGGGSRLVDITLKNVEVCNRIPNY